MTNKQNNFWLLLTLLLIGVWPLLAVADGAWDGTEEGEALTRGPVHEAFAQPVPVETGERYIIATKPPDPIQELPPEEKPAGDEVIWISGYWHYDDEANELIWISGCWRAVPLGMSWIPGYWQEIAEGYEWISGYWHDRNAGNASYLPAPPASLERGPSSTAPNEDSIWVPGSWVWMQNKYVWRPGYWLMAQPDRVWVPSYYTYTPYGYVYVDGYWDYALATRGVAFLPMRFSSGVYLRRGFYYSPRLVVGVDLFYSDLFFSLNRRHYYFGDYYAAHYVSLNYYPWFSIRSRVQVYDHLYIYARWTNRRDANWVKRQRQDYIYRQKHVEARPPRVYRPEPSAKTRPAGSWAGRGKDGKPPIRPLKEIAQEKGSGRRFEKLSTQQRQQWSASNKRGERPRDDNAKSDGPRRPEQKPGHGDRERPGIGGKPDGGQIGTRPGGALPPNRRDERPTRPETTGTGAARPTTTQRPATIQPGNLSPSRDHQPQPGSSRPATTTPGSTVTSGGQARQPEVRQPGASEAKQSNPTSVLTGRQPAARPTPPAVSAPTPPAVLAPTPPNSGTDASQRPSQRPVVRPVPGRTSGTAPFSTQGRDAGAAGRGDSSSGAALGGRGQQSFSPTPSSPRVTPPVDRGVAISPTPSESRVPETVLEREQSPWGGQSSAPGNISRPSSATGQASRPTRSSFQGNRNSGRAGSRRGSR